MNNNKNINKTNGDDKMFKNDNEVFEYVIAQVSDMSKQYGDFKVRGITEWKGALNPKATDVLFTNHKDRLVQEENNTHIGRNFVVGYGLPSSVAFNPAHTVKVYVDYDFKHNAELSKDIKSSNKRHIEKLLVEQLRKESTRTMLFGPTIRPQVHNNMMKPVNNTSDNTKGLGGFISTENGLIVVVKNMDIPIPLLKFAHYDEDTNDTVFFKFCGSVTMAQTKDMVSISIPLHATLKFKVDNALTEIAYKIYKEAL